MTERTTPEILSAQLEFDVCEARAAVEQELGNITVPGLAGGRFGESLERLIGTVVARWWFERARMAEKITSDAKDAEERRMARLQVLMNCLNIIVAKSGPPQMETQQISILSLQCENAALWGALVHAGIVTPSLKQDYIDGGVLDLLARVQQYSQKIMVADASGNLKTGS